MAGYVEPRKKADDGYRIIPFNNKREKWEYMKAHNLDEIFLEIKAVFGDVKEPVLRRKI